MFLDSNQIRIDRIPFSNMHYHSAYGPPLLPPIQYFTVLPLLTDPSRPNDYPIYYCLLSSLQVQYFLPAMGLHEPHRGSLTP